MLERETRLELATICLEGRNSNQLSYFRIWYSPEESNFMCRLIRPILNTVEDEPDMFQFSKINLAAKEGSAPSPRVSKTLVLLLHHSAIN